MSILHMYFLFVFEQNISEKAKPEISLPFTTMQNSIKRYDPETSEKLRIQPSFYLNKMQSATFVTL